MNKDVTKLKCTVFYDAGGLTYQFPFEYLKKEFVKVKYMNGTTSDDIDFATPLTYPTDYTITDKTLTLKKKNSEMSTVMIYRNTDTEPLVDYKDASFLQAKNFNIANDQQIHLNEEMSDYVILHSVPTGLVSSVTDVKNHVDKQKEDMDASIAETRQEMTDTKTIIKEEHEEIEDLIEEGAINAQSTNIKQFTNRTSLTQSTALTPDVLVFTQNAEKVGDNGGATYRGSDTTKQEDGYSIIKTQTRVQKGRVGWSKVGSSQTTDFIQTKVELVVPQEVDVRWFGAKLDGQTDDSDAVNRAIQYIKDHSVKLNNMYSSHTLYFPKGLMKIQKPITIDVSIMSVKGEGTIIEATGTTKALIIKGSSSSPFGQCTNSIEGLKLVGAKLDAGSIGIEFDGSGQNAHLNIRNVYITDFNTGIQYGNNTYCINHFNVQIANCDVGVFFPQYFANGGERLTFLSCTIHNNEIGVRIYANNVSMYFNNCSLDYNNDLLIDLSEETVVYFTDCHIEWNSNGKAHFKNNSKAGALFLKGCYLVPVVKNGKGEYAFDNTTNKKRYGGIFLDGCYFGGNFEGAYDALISGNSYHVMNSCLQYEPPRVCAICRQSNSRMWIQNIYYYGGASDNVSFTLQNNNEYLRVSPQNKNGYIIFERDILPTMRAFYVLFKVKGTSAFETNGDVKMHVEYRYRNKYSGIPFTTQIAEQGSVSIKDKLNQAFNAGTPTMITELFKIDASRSREFDILLNPTVAIKLEITGQTSVHSIDIYQLEFQPF